MEILIAGAGKVGNSVAEQLTQEGHNITMIDARSNVLELAQSSYDVNTVMGNSASMTVLQNAEVETKDILIAATNSDEINMLTCSVAKSLNPNINCIARIRNPQYVDQAYRMADQFGLALVINPERQAAHEIAQLIRVPGTLQRDTFVKARIEVIELKVGERLKGTKLFDLEKITRIKVLVCAVSRDGDIIMPDGNFVLKENDHIYVTAKPNELHRLLYSLGVVKKDIKNVLITGGGRISYYLAQELTKARMKMHIIERDRETCEMLAELLPNVTIVHGDAASRGTLESEELGTYDAVVSCTGIDEVNIVTSMVASLNNVPLTITKVGRGDNVEVVNALPIGPAVCPKELCTDHIVSYVRAMGNTSGSALSVHTIARGQAEILEFQADENTKYIGKQFRDIPIKKNILIVCVGHGLKSEVANGNSSYQVGDTVVVVAGEGSLVTNLNDIFEDAD